MTNSISTKTYFKKNLGTEKYSFQAKLHCEEIESIVAASCTPAIRNHENLSGSVSLSGVAKVEIVFQDKQQILRSVSQMIDFSPSFEGKSAEQFFFSCKEEETSAQLLQNDEVVVSSVFAIEMEGLSSCELIAPAPGNEFFEQTKTINLQVLSAVSDDKIVVVDETEISATGILKTDATCLVSKVTPSDDALVVDGELLVSVCSEIDGNPKTTFKRIEFSSEVAALGAKPTNLADFSCNIESCTATIVEGGTNATLTISATLKFVALCFETTPVVVLDDAFSVASDLMVSTTGFENQKFVEKTYAETNLSATLATKDKTVNMGSILAVVSPIVVETEKGLSLECTVIYRHAETDKVESIVLNAPVFVEKNSRIVIKSFAKKKAKEVDIELVAVSTKESIESTYETYVSAIEEGAPLEADNKAIVVYSATKGQSLFSIAKALKASPDTLKNQNLDLDDILPENRKIVLYKKVTAKF